MEFKKTNNTTGSARRARSDSPDISSKKLCTTSEHITPSIDPEYWPRFLIISSLIESQPLTKVSPFAVSKGIKGIAGEPKEIKALPSGDILVEVTRRSHCENLLRSTILANIPVRVTPHKTLNHCRGVIRCSNLNVCDDDEIVGELRSQGVTHIRCITRKTPEGVVKTGAYFLTFITPSLPEFILAGYLRIKVDPFIPNLLHCFNCQMFGHGQSRCTRNKVCAKCATPGHHFEECVNEPKCANCNGSHASSDKKCPQWLIEKDIQNYKVKNNCSFKEARNIIMSRISPNTSATSYAKVLKPTLKDSFTQTNFSSQVSGEEIDQASPVSHSSQTSNCTFCPHCNPQITISVHKKDSQKELEQSKSNNKKGKNKNGTKNKISSVQTSNKYASLPVEEIHMQTETPPQNYPPKHKPIPPDKQKPPGPKEAQTKKSNSGSKGPLNEACFTDEEEMSVDIHPAPVGDQEGRKFNFDPVTFDK